MPYIEILYHKKSDLVGLVKIILELPDGGQMAQMWHTFSASKTNKFSCHPWLLPIASFVVSGF